VDQDFDAILGAVIEAAKQGDLQAASLLLSRVAPPLKPVQEPVRVALPDGTLTEKAAAILDRAAAGELSTADAKQLLDGLGQVARIAEIDELTRRVEALEQARTRP
jgi:hypothetical protein